MTLAQLKRAIADLRPELDDYEVLVWLPGSRISLSAYVGPVDRKAFSILIEGNVKQGSMLS